MKHFLKKVGIYLVNSFLWFLVGFITGYYVGNILLN